MSPRVKPGHWYLSFSGDGAMSSNSNFALCSPDVLEVAVWKGGAVLVKAQRAFKLKSKVHPG